MPQPVGPKGNNERDELVERLLNAIFQSKYAAEKERLKGLPDSELLVHLERLASPQKKYLPGERSATLFTKSLAAMEAAQEHFPCSDVGERIFARARRIFEHLRFDIRHFDRLEDSMAEQLRSYISGMMRYAPADVEGAMEGFARQHSANIFLSRELPRTYALISEILPPDKRDCILRSFIDVLIAQKNFVQNHVVSDLGRISPHDPKWTEMVTGYKTRAHIMVQHATVEQQRALVSKALTMARRNPFRYDERNIEAMKALFKAVFPGIY